MNFASVTRLGLLLYAVAFTVAQGLPSNKTVKLSVTTRSGPVDRIYGGTAVDATKYPYIVNLSIDDKFLCGGTLIAPQFVVTAAHCVSDNPVYATATMGSMVRAVNSYTIHPYYNADTHDNDIAVLKLQSAVSIKTVGLAKANGSDNKVGAAAVVLGWGRTESGEVNSNLKQVSLQLISNADCRKANAGQFAISSGMLCAWGGVGKDSCQGDSGGPLFANGVLVGIVSFGQGCGQAPGVYARVSSYRDFVYLVVNGRRSRSFTKIAPQSATTEDIVTTTLKTETATTAGDSTIQTGGLTGGVVAVIILALCAVVSVAGFTIYKRLQNRNGDAVEDVYYQQPPTPATRSTRV